MEKFGFATVHVCKYAYDCAQNFLGVCAALTVQGVLWLFHQWVLQSIAPPNAQFSLHATVHVICGLG